MGSELDMRHADEVFGVIRPSNKYCHSCVYGYGDPPMGDLPSKVYCQVYTPENSTGKPRDVAYNGMRCEYYKAR